jgi:GNAT superfamily N-acetyltransferase
MNRHIELELRPLAADDLDRANAVVEAAVMTWDLPARVKRLSLPSYRYHIHDLEHLTLFGAEDLRGAIVAVAAWEPASIADTPHSARGLLLHGLYVVPALHGTGIGSRLFDAAIKAARHGGYAGLLVKANPEAMGFFVARGMQQLSPEDTRRDYPYRFWAEL